MGVPLVFDEVHDEFFIECLGVVVVSNGKWVVSEDELFRLVDEFWERFPDRIAYY